MIAGARSGWALAVDVLGGEPPTALHPTVWMGRWIGAARDSHRARHSGPAASLLAGAAVVGTGALVAAVIAAGAERALRRALGTPALRGHPATLHLRSLTKDHALAGIRLGYVVGPSALVAAVERGRMPWTVPAPAQAAAVAVCASDAAAHVLRTTALLRAAAAELRDALHVIGVTACPSDVHYLLLEVGDASRVARIVGEQYSLGVRDCTSFGLPAHIRVAARTPDDNQLLVAALDAVCTTDRAAAALHSRPVSHA